MPTLVSLVDQYRPKLPHTECSTLSYLVNNNNNFISEETFSLVFLSVKLKWAGINYKIWTGMKIFGVFIVLILTLREICIDY